MTTRENDPEDVLTVDEAAAWLRVHRATLYAAIDRGEVPARRIGRSIRLSRRILSDWISCRSPTSQG